jgi:oligosaccharide repeat unit polymerase
LQSQNRFLKPIFFAGWSCVAAVAVWQTQVGSSDSVLALTSGFLLLVTLALSRYVLGLGFTTGPMLYLTLLGLFHLGLVVPWALGIYDIARAPWFAPYGLAKSMGLIGYSILAYQLGLVVAVGLGGGRERPSVGDGSGLENRNLFLTGNLIFLVGAIMFVIAVIRLDPAGYYRLTYSETFRLRAESDPRLFGTGMTFVSIGLCLAVAGASKRQLRATFLGAGFWVIALFYLGFRGPALIAGLIVYAVALKKRVMFPRWLPWLAAALLLVAVPMERLVRDKPLNERSSTFSLHDINILDGPAEMGATIRPLVETEAVMGPTNYRHGQTYLIGLKAVLPNLALRWQATSQASLDDLPPNHWITAIADPWAYRNYGGIGFSAIAEPYMNFGLPGVVVYFFLIALLLIWLEQASIRSPYALACWALLLGPLLWTTRNDFANFFRPAIWGLLFLGVARIFGGNYSITARNAHRGSV